MADRPIEFFISIPMCDGSKKIVRAFKHDEFSSWCWHGTGSTAFWDMSKASKGWRVAHVRTGLSIGADLFKLNFRDAAALALELENTVEGASQIALSDIEGPMHDRVLGWRGSPMQDAIGAINRFAASKGMELPFPLTEEKGADCPRKGE